jgi:hypothetical protein
LSAEVYNWRDVSGTTEETVSLTNISPTLCTLSGYASLGVNAANGTPLPAPTHDVDSFGPPPAVGTTTTVPASLVALSPGGRGWFELSFSDVCDHVLPPGATPTGVPNECYAGTWLTVEPVEGAEPLVVSQPLRLTYATAGFLVGPFVAGTPAAPQ